MGLDFYTHKMVRVLPWFSKNKELQQRILKRTWLWSGRPFFFFFWVMVAGWFWLLYDLIAGRWVTVVKWETRQIFFFG